MPQRHHPLCRIIHVGDCFRPNPPVLSRQDATLSEEEFPIRHKKKAANQTKLWSEEDKENFPPSYDVKKADPECHVHKEAEHDASVQ